MSETLSRLIDREAGPYVVQVEFDRSGAVASFCAERSPHGNPWHPRKRLAERTEEVLAVEHAPACLSGARLDFNRRGAKLAEIRAVRAQCRREALPGAEQPLPQQVSQRNQAVRYGRCVASEQIRRGEIWDLMPGQVYVRSEGGAERRSVIRACTVDVTKPFSASQRPGVTRVLVNFAEVGSCLGSHGWQPMFDFSPLEGQGP